VPSKSNNTAFNMISPLTLHVNINLKDKRINNLVNSTTGKRMKELEDRLSELEKQILLEQNKTNNKRFSKEKNHSILSSRP